MDKNTNQIESAPVEQLQPAKLAKSCKVPIIIMAIVIVCLLGVIGAGVWFYLSQPKCATTAVINKTDTDATVATDKLLSNDVYKTYTYTQELTTINGDPCNTTSVLSLYKDQNIAVLSDGNCFGGELKVGTYDVYPTKVMIEFKTRVGLDGDSKLNLREDISYHGSGKQVLMTLNDDGTATSTLFTGDRLYIKR